MKTCVVCGACKPASAFPPKRARCRECLRAEERAIIDASRRWIEEYARRWHRAAGTVVHAAVAFVEGPRYGRSRTVYRPLHFYYRARHDAIMAYGGYRCACCGEGDPRFLTLDHIHNGGAEHRRQVRSNHIFRWLRNRGYPPGFQVLCWNCNCGRYHNGGECPHDAQRRANGAGATGQHERSTRPRTRDIQFRRSFR